MASTQRIAVVATRLRKSPALRLFLVSLGYTTIFLLWFIHPAVEPQQRAYYHWSGPAASFFIPIAIDFLVLWLVLFLLLWAGRRPGRLRVIVWAGLPFVLPWSILKNLEALSLIQPNHLGRVLFLGALLLTITLVVVWQPAFSRRFESFVSGITTVLMFVGIFGGLLVCRLAWYGLEAGLLEGPFPLHQAQITSPPKSNRIIWIVMDELSYQQTYERRFPGLDLPAFDALAKDATSFTQDLPADIQTEVVFPGLFAGKPFDNIRTSALARLSVHDPTTGKWQPFDQQDTVFRDALNSGYSTAIAGWYNPYCRIVPAVVDQCFWTFRLDTVPTDTVLSNTLAPVAEMLAKVPTFGFYSVQNYLLRPLQATLRKQSLIARHVDDYQLLDAASNKLLLDRSASFVLLHLPVPHPLGIYDRHTDKFTVANSSYINNLALADKCLAGFVQTLKQTGQWDSSTIVVMGDHSWRTKQIWRYPKIEHAWSQEDKDASNDGQYDPRPVYIVKLPGQTTGSRIDTPYHASNTRKLFDAIMTHQINTPADLSAWAQQVH